MRGGFGVTIGIGELADTVSEDMSSAVAVSAAIAAVKEPAVGARV
jgi:hypothetical protein